MSFHIALSIMYRSSVMSQPKQMGFPFGETSYICWSFQTPLKLGPCFYGITSGDGHGSSASRTLVACSTIVGVHNVSSEYNDNRRSLLDRVLADMAGKELNGFGIGIGWWCKLLDVSCKDLDICIQIFP